ncbi:TetR/AcrR family transcriptional regulator [Cryobacterium sp. TMS1-20-1]|uniref:TetR/AcrR family transcriptional regulator n=1 Tax=Cryobacterium sp. TMS1-20-1 TaxID=1259223 RepID=UPI00141BED6C|nr:TetR/AcrR family transcriptional regulator [Cryobacterium sp. TMS1-20-1]
MIAAAIAVMSERGYSATSVQEVADRVGVLKGSLYHYFSSKEGLLFRILEESHQQNAEIISRVSQLELSAFEELIEYMRQSSTWYLANIERANIFFTESRHLTGDRLAEAQKLGRNFEKHVQKLIALAQESGDVRGDIDHRLISRYVLGSLNSVRLSPNRTGQQLADQTIVDALIDLTRAAIQAPRAQ